MTKSWQGSKNILVIRADNMGDLIMSAPAIRALKESFAANITVLTSSMAAAVAPFIAEIHDVLVFDLPWVKANECIGNEEVFTLVELIKQRCFDAAVIFTVFSQNPLPAAMIAYMAGIPLRLAYCRENPYGLLTDWVPDKEPYTFIQHQVERDLALVETVGASTHDSRLHLTVVEDESVNITLQKAGVDLEKRWIIFHPGVSEKKREYPPQLWIQAAQKVIREKDIQILFTGAASEKQMCDELAAGSGSKSFSVAGLFSLQQFIAVVKEAPLVVSVNTGTVHIAAAVNTPVVVLYAQTNPQHAPWRVAHKVLEFEVDVDSRSKNEVIQFMYASVYNKRVPFPTAADIADAVNELLEMSSERFTPPAV